MKGEKLIKSVGSKTEEHEFYTPFPQGYKIGRTKYVVITGTVMSGLGKGIFSSSLAKVLQDYGLNCTPIKFDGYLNVDAGTLNPYRHGEVFVLDDGLECDMDLGTYERFLDKNLCEKNYLTGGKIFKRILYRERGGKYLGRDVQFIPHVTGEIKLFLRELAIDSKADVIFIEVGGTVGDIENAYFIEAMRQLAYEEGKENVSFVTLTYVLEPGFLGEQKSKAAQLGIRSLMSLGIQPDIIACRSNNPVTKKVREKISIYANIPFERVVSVHDVDSIYNIPGLVQKAGIDKEIIKILGLEKKIKKNTKAIKQWKNYVQRMKNKDNTITIGITGKYTGLRDSYASIIKALEHAGTYYKTKVNIKWIETTEIEDGKLNIIDALADVDGVIVPGGFGKRGAEGKISCIKFIRDNNIPFLGICYGFQMAVIEFARNVCGLKNANSTEIDDNTKHPVIDILPEQKEIEGLGGNMKLGGHNIEVKKGTLAYELFKSTKVRMRFRHRFEVNPEYIELLERSGMIFSGKAPNQPIMQILEIKKHRYFIATQAHPCFTSRPLRPQPLFLGLVKAALDQKKK